MAQNETITRKALGRAAQLGFLYDVRTDKFSGCSLFTKSLPESLIVSTDVPSSRLEYDYSDSFESKFQKLDVQAELKVSVLSGLFKLDGSAKYFNDEKLSKKSVKGSLIYEIKTKEETFCYTDLSMKPIICYEALNIKDATHVVIGIKWGANVIASFEYSNENNESKTEIEGKLKANIEKIQLSIGSPLIKFDETQNELRTGFKVKFFGDFLTENKELPQTFEAALDLMKNIPEFIKKYNNGKGSPLEYRLCPISKFEQFFKCEQKFSRISEKINIDIIKQVENFFDQISESKQEFNDFYNDVIRYRDLIQDEQIKDIENNKNEISINEAKFKENLGNLLVKVRFGNENPLHIKTLLAEFEQTPCSSSNISLFIQKYNCLTEYISKICLLEKKQIKFLSKLKRKNSILIEHAENDIYILNFDSKLKAEDSKLYNSNFGLFLNLSQDPKQKHAKFYIVNYEIHPEIQGNKKIKIEYIRNGKFVSDDLYEEKKEILEMCLAKPIDMKILKKPLRIVTLKIPCPGMSEKCSKEYRNWICEKCKTDLDYGYDKMFYCECGGALADNYSFKCSDPNHPNRYLQFKKEVLENFLPSGNDENEINILLLGETGVGKSTFINGLINYLTYNCFDDALNGELKVAIPAKFSITDENFEEREIKIGNSDNESDVVGQSATQSAKAHVIRIGNMSLRINDTPGIGDTRGIEVDKQNFENILSYISYFPYLNGICILLKPNAARLTLAFRFCIKELLTYLHKDTKDNIVFCFTNSRGTFYRPGDTFPALKKLLNELEKDTGTTIPVKENVFCYDNESFRFLAAVRNGVEFGSDEKVQFANSWGHAVDTTNKMVQYIMKCPQHNTCQTVTLNEARKLISELSKPIADISQNIQYNIKLAEDKKRELDYSESSINDLQKNLYMPQYDLNTICLERPQTVCTSNRCVSYVKRQNSEAFITNYVTVCHKDCFLDNVSKEVIACNAIQGCKAFINGRCMHCRCEWTKHMHITYRNEQIKVQAVNPEIQKKIDEKKEASEIIKAFKQCCESHVKELQYEQKQIIETSSKFANFLRKNAIAPFNDDLLHYLEHTIREEEGKKSCGGNNDSIIEGLRDFKNSYEGQIKIYENALKSDANDEKITPDDVYKLIKNLYSLKHNGKKLEDIVQNVQYAKKSIFQFREEHHEVKNNDNGLRRKIKDGAKNIYKTTKNLFI